MTNFSYLEGEESYLKLLSSKNFEQLITPNTKLCTSFLFPPYFAKICLPTNFFLHQLLSNIRKDYITQ